jgi:chromosome segregation ATPase
MSKTQKQIDEFFKAKKEQLETLQPRSQMILNDEPLPSSKKKYQVTELDRALEQFKGTSEWTNEKQLEWELKRKEESHKQELERMAKERAELYVENVLLKRKVKAIKENQKVLQTQLEELKTQLSMKNMARICMEDDAERYYSELKDYKNLQSEVHKDIEKVWMYDSSHPLNDVGEIERTKLIERVFYKIANEWLDGDNLQPLSK